MRAISFLLLGVAVFVAGCVEGPPEPLPAADAPSTAAVPTEGSLEEAREPAAGIAEPS